MRGARREKQIPVQALVWTGEREKLVKTQLEGLCLDVRREGPGKKTLEK